MSGLGKLAVTTLGVALLAGCAGVRTVQQGTEISAADEDWGVVITLDPKSNVPTEIYVEGPVGGPDVPASAWSVTTGRTADDRPRVRIANEGK